ncbi:MAG: hypothetical protein PHO48_04765 [Candidatus Gracilibacteria bacterium]|nr:hypothetical protein [Candidatus Gracilibacteria bacterium]MDD5179615.1 hypothetical protein [Candidatus Gracilibacteria bacterium]
MQVDINPLLAKTPNCTFANSNKYFDDGSKLQHIEFVRLLDTDVFVQTSFVVTGGKISITGGVIQSFTKDNTEDENFIFYSLPIGKLYTADLLTVDLGKQTNLFKQISPMILTMPWVAVILFYIISYFIPFLKYLDWIALAAVILIYSVAGIRFALRYLKAKRVKFAEQTVIYLVEKDILNLPKSAVESLIPLIAQGVVTATIYQNTLYLKQTTSTQKIFSKPIPSETLQTQMQNILNYLLSDSFTAQWLGKIFYRKRKKATLGGSSVGWRNALLHFLTVWQTRRGFCLLRIYFVFK